MREEPGGWQAWAAAMGVVGGGGVQIKLIEILARTTIHTKLFGSCAHIPVIIPFVPCVYDVPCRGFRDLECIYFLKLLG